MNDATNDAMKNDARMRARPPANNRFRSRRLGAAAAGLGTTVVASSASAVIIWNDTSSVSTSQSIFLDGTALSEIVLSTSSMMGDLSLSLDSPIGMMGADSSTVDFVYFGGMGSPNFLDPLSALDTVDGSLNYRGEAFLIDASAQNTSWNPGETAYVGFRFDPTGTQPLYGWLELTFDSNGTDLHVSDWAYEDSGLPIGVSVIPEPGTALLLGVGLGLMGIGLRKKKQSVAARGSDG